MNWMLMYILRGFKTPGVWVAMAIALFFLMGCASKPAPTAEDILKQKSRTPSCVKPEQLSCPNGSYLYTELKGNRCVWRWTCVKTR